jgi:hypothetical protein
MPTSENGYSYFLVVVDLFTSFCLTRPQKTKGAEETAQNLYTIFCEWGPPKVLQSDEGTEFVNKVLTEVGNLMGVELKVSTPHYKHSTGSVERLNRTISTSLKKMLNGMLAVWDVALPAVTHHYNTTVRSLTNSSPYALMFCREHNVIDGSWYDTVEDIDIDSWLSANDYEHWIEQHKQNLHQHLQKHTKVLEEVYPAIRSTIKRKREQEAKAFAKKHRIAPEIPVGTKVRVRDVNRSSKYAQTFHATHTVKEITPTGSYILVDDDGDTIRRAREHIEIYRENDDRISVEVERIIRHENLDGAKPKFFVKWKNRPHKFNQWLTIEDFDDRELVDEYLARVRPRVRQTKRQQSGPKRRRRN